MSNDPAWFLWMKFLLDCFVVPLLVMGLAIVLIRNR